MSVATPPSRPERQSPPNPDDHVRAVADHLQATRRRVIRGRVATGLLLAASAVGLALGSVALADYYFELVVSWRAGALLLALSGAALGSAFAWRRWIAPYSLSQAAADTEDRVAQFGQRLRTTLDYEKQSPRPAQASAGLLSALRRDASRIAQQADWHVVVDSRPLIRACLLALFLVACGAIVLVVSPEMRIAAGRSLLVSWHYTTVTYTPQSTIAKFGESVPVKVEVAGRPIAAATLRYRPAKSQATWTTLSLTPAEDTPALAGTSDGARRLHGPLAATLADLRQDIEFEVLAGPQSLPLGSVRVLQPLSLAKAEAHVMPPAYTGKPEETVESLDLKVLEGSNVVLRLRLNRPAAEALLTRLDDREEKSSAGAVAEQASTSAVPLNLSDELIQGTLSDLRKSASFSIFARASDGMTLEPLRLTIRVQLDRKPQVRFIQPAEELVVTPTTETPLVAEADDDLGLGKVGVMVQLGGGPMQTLWEHDAAGDAEPLRMAPMLMLEDHRLSYQDGVTYYAFAEDNYFGKPRRATTPLRFIDIRPFKVAYQVVESEGSCKGCSTTLEELIFRQRHNLTQAFSAQEQEPLNREFASRLAAAQSDLLEKTSEFAAGMAERAGPIPALEEAVEFMKAAVRDLSSIKALAAAQTSSGAPLAPAVTAEQDALAALIRARKNIRKILKQSNSPSASACRKFDREQRQKLRLPEQKQQDQQRQLAESRAKLEDLAKRERQWSQQAQQACNSPSQGQSKKPQGQPSASSSAAQGEGQKPSGKPSASSSPSQGEGQKPSEQPSESGQPEQGEAQTPSAEELAKAQEQMRAELAEIQKQIEQLEAAGQAAQRAAQQAGESMQQGLKELANKDGAAAAKEGQRSAEQLEQLSAHLAAMHARDFGERLDQAQQLAQQLAARQASLAERVGGNDKSDSKSGNKPGDKSGDKAGDKPGDNPGDKPGSSSGAEGEPSGPSQAGQPGEGRPGEGPRGEPQLASAARDQQELAGQVDLLGDLLDGLERDAAGETGAVRQSLEQARAENPPSDIAGGMRQTAEDLQAQRAAQAARGAAQARQRLEELSQTLGTARAEYAQPQLQELMALEEQLAKLIEHARRAAEKPSGQPGEENRSAQDAAEQKWQAMQAQLEALAAADPRLQKALEQLRAQSAQSGKDQQTGQAAAGTAPPQPGAELQPAPFTPGGNQTPRDGHYSWLRLGDFNGIQQVSKALQVKIQEAILAAALMDADQPAPPEYKELVEEYYRALSDDLR